MFLAVYSFVIWDHAINFDDCLLVVMGMVSKNECGGVSSDDGNWVE